MWVRGLQPHLSSQTHPSSRKPSQSFGGAAVEVPHCLAHLCGHAAPRLKKLPDRAANGHEALGEVDPQHKAVCRAEGAGCDA